MEMIEEFLLLLLEVLELLEFNFVLPLHFFIFALELFYFNLASSEFHLDVLVLLVLFHQLLNLVICFFERVHDLSVLLLLCSLVFLFVLVFPLLLGKVFLKLLDNVEIRARDLIVVLFDRSVLTSVLGC